MEKKKEYLHNDKELELKTRLKQYGFIRDEMMNRQNQRTNMTYFLLFALLGLWGAAASTKISWLVIVGPWISFFILYQAYETYRLHNVQADYVWEIEENVAKLLKEEELLKDENKWQELSLGWQHYGWRESRRKHKRSLVRKLSFLLVTWISIAVIPLAMRPVEIIDYVILAIDVLIGVIATYYFAYRLRRIHLFHKE